MDIKTYPPQKSTKYKIATIDRMVGINDETSFPCREVFFLTVRNEFSGKILLEKSQMGFGKNSFYSGGQPCWGWETRKSIHDEFSIEPQIHYGKPTEWQEVCTTRRIVQESHSFWGDEWTEKHLVETTEWQIDVVIEIETTGEKFPCKMKRSDITKTRLS